MTIETNFDGIVGPTHNYSGLSYGNVASTSHKKQTSYPRQAALQGLEKMHYLAKLGIKQGIIPPQERPHLPTLRQLGFSGSEASIIKTAFTTHPELFFACCSSSSMWTANAATVAPSVDTLDARVIIVPANLCYTLHRSIESPMTRKILQKIFADTRYFAHYGPIPSNYALTDEGAANHTRFADANGDGPGVHLFVYGRGQKLPKKFPARQTLEASQAVARLLQLDSRCVIFAQQNPDAIDAGVFHNDVISVGHRNLFFYHEKAFLNTSEVIKELSQKIKTYCFSDMILIEVKETEISLADAVSSYLFNSQIVTLPNGKFHLIAPQECHDMPAVNAYLQALIENNNNPIEHVHYIDIRESMQNGGGPACLRFRLSLQEAECAAVLPSIWMTDELYDSLKLWVSRHYRESLQPSDLADPDLLTEGRIALDELTKILKLGSIYSFQQ